MTRFSDFEDEDIEYTLSVSQFAKLCNTTRDTLRYYYGWLLQLIHIYAMR